VILFRNLLHFYSTDFSAVSAVTSLCAGFFLGRWHSGVCDLRITLFIFWGNLLSTYPINPAETSVEAAAMVTVEARAMVAMMAAVNAMVIAVCLRHAKSYELWSMEAWCGCSVLVGVTKEHLLCWWCRLGPSDVGGYEDPKWAWW